jgi:hypothetical protein
MLLGAISEPITHRFALREPDPQNGAFVATTSHKLSLSRRATLALGILFSLGAWASTHAQNAASHRETKTASHVSTDAKPTPAQTAAVKLAFGANFADMAPFHVGQADLNGDGRPDLIIVSQNPLNCGSHGCNVFALLATANGFAAKGIDLGIIFQGKDFVVLDTVHNGMHDLRVDNGSDVLVWGGKQYQ